MLIIILFLLSSPTTTPQIMTPVKTTQSTTLQRMPPVNSSPKIKYIKSTTIMQKIIAPLGSMPSVATFSYKKILELDNSALKPNPTETTSPAYTAFLSSTTSPVSTSRELHKVIIEGSSGLYLGLFFVITFFCYYFFFGHLFYKKNK